MQVNCAELATLPEKSLVRRIHNGLKVFPGYGKWCMLIVRIHHACAMVGLMARVETSVHPKFSVSIVSWNANLVMSTSTTVARYHAASGVRPIAAVAGDPQPRTTCGKSSWKLPRSTPTRRPPLRPSSVYRRSSISRISANCSKAYRHRLAQKKADFSD